MCEDVLNNEEIINDESCIKEDNVDFEALYNEEKAKNEELNDKYLRILAEYDNFRKRTLKEKEMLYQIIQADTAKAFLPALDNINRATDAYNDNETVKSGLLMIAKQFEEILSSINVEKIPAVGEEFNPELHDAIMHVEDDSVGANIIVEELTPGYKIGDRVIRHSIVKVAN